ncbi:MAG: hypothetical protein M1358_15735 [Chloroflexi bacterium]|nr:hypothetical protein [Chloroflexota bacterium]
MFKIARGIIKGYDGATHSATVQVVGSGATYLASVPVATDIPGWRLKADSSCAVLFFDENNPRDCCLVAVYDAVPNQRLWTSTTAVNSSFTAQAYTDLVSVSPSLDRAADLVAFLWLGYYGTTVRAYAGAVTLFLDGVGVGQYLRFAIGAANAYYGLAMTAHWSNAAAGAHTLKAGVYVQYAGDTVNLAANSLRLVVETV